MNRDQWEAYWQGLKRRVEYEPCPGWMGLDLIRGSFIRTVHIVNIYHHQVFGREAFLRNMLQRILEADLAQTANQPLIVAIVPNEKADLLEEVNRVFANTPGEEENILLFYTPVWSKRSVSLERAKNLLESDRPVHLFLELEAKERPLDHPLLVHLTSEIKRKWKEAIYRPHRQRQPFIYLFCPEDMGFRDHVVRYIEGLKEHTGFRIFSEDTRIFFNCAESSSIYGPDLYPAKTYEKMRRNFYRQFEQKRKWEEKHTFFGASENPEILKAVRASAAEIPITRTAFGRFKVPHDGEYEHFWFYPIRQNLGSLTYHRPLKVLRDKSVPQSAQPPAPVKDPILEIINDLRPKSES